jgi:hypothetical protein
MGSEIETRGAVVPCMHAGRASLRHRLRLGLVRSAGALVSGEHGQGNQARAPD